MNKRREAGRSLTFRAGNTVKWNVSDLPASRRLFIEVTEFEGCDSYRLQPKQPVSIGELIMLWCGPEQASTLLALKLTTSSTKGSIAVSLTPLVKFEGSRERVYRRSD